MIARRDRVKGLDTYFDSIADSQPLSRKREAVLGRRIRRGDMDARKELVEANLRFVVAVAKQFQDRGLSLVELISAGNFGLMVAADRFDERLGWKFISYAVWWIRQAIQQALVDDVRTIRLAMSVYGRLRKIAGVTERDGVLMDALKGEMVVRAARALDLSVGQVEEALTFGGPVVSLDELQDGFDELLVARTPDTSVEPPDQSLYDMERQACIGTALLGLDRREQRIVREHFGLDGERAMTLQEIGDAMGLTRERVRQLKERALNKLRRPGRCEALRELDTV